MGSRLLARERWRCRFILGSRFKVVKVLLSDSYDVFIGLFVVRNKLRLINYGGTLNATSPTSLSLAATPREDREYRRYFESRTTSLVLLPHICFNRRWVIMRISSGCWIVVVVGYVRVLNGVACRGGVPTISIFLPFWRMLHCMIAMRWRVRVLIEGWHSLNNYYYLYITASNTSNHT